MDDRVPKFNRPDECTHHAAKQDTQEDETIVVNENDILFGRGGKNNQHSGNKHLRDVAQMHKAAYNSASKKQKSEISRYLVEHIKKLNPPGRFIKMNTLTGRWEQVSEEAAREKAAQVLRDAEVSTANATPPRQNHPPPQVHVTSDKISSLGFGNSEHSGLHNLSNSNFWVHSTHSPAPYHSMYPCHYNTATENQGGEAMWQDETSTIHSSYNVTSQFHWNNQICASPKTYTLIQSMPGSPHFPVIEPVPLSDISTSPWSTPVRSPYRNFYSHMLEGSGGDRYSSPRSARVQLAQGRPLCSTSDGYRPRDAVSFNETPHNPRYYNNFGIDEPCMPGNDHAYRYSSTMTDSLGQQRYVCDRGQSFEERSYVEHVPPIASQESFPNYNEARRGSSSQATKERKHLVTPHTAPAARWHQHGQYFTRMRDDPFS